MKSNMERIPGIGPQSAKVLMESGFDSIRSLANATVEQLSAIPGFGAVRAAKVIHSAALLAERPSEDAPSGAIIETTSPASRQGDAAAERGADEKVAEKKNKTKKKKKKKKKKRNDPVAVWAAYKRAARKQSSSR